MTDIFVQFSDETALIVVAEFGCEQDPKYFPNQSIVSDSDIRYQSFLESQRPNLDQLARELRDELLKKAGLRISPLQDAVDLQIATSTELLLLNEWKKYRVQLVRVVEQEGYPDTISWPVIPESETLIN